MLNWKPSFVCSILIPGTDTRHFIFTRDMFYTWFMYKMHVIKVIVAFYIHKWILLVNTMKMKCSQLKDRFTVVFVKVKETMPYHYVHVASFHAILLIATLHWLTLWNGEQYWKFGLQFKVIHCNHLAIAAIIHSLNATVIFRYNGNLHVPL